MRKRRNYEDTLDLADTDAYEGEEVQEESCSQDSLLDDYKFVKKELRKSLKTNQEVVNILLEELKADPSPRMAEVVARLLEAVASSGLQILNASKMVAEIHKLTQIDKKEEKTLAPTIQNAIFVGKLEDVFKLQDAQKQKMLENGNDDPYQ